MTFKLQDLPFSPDALDPVISAETLSVHHGKHHRGYVDKLNQSLNDVRAPGVTLESLICQEDGALFNLAAQIWNHDFYWHSLKPGGGGEPVGDLRDAIVRDFGSCADFARGFGDVAKSHFGSGWAWLVSNDQGKLGILSTSDAGNPLRDGLQPLLTLDVWEHAYYIDYRNRRAAYVDACIEHLLNWDHAQTCYAD